MQKPDQWNEVEKEDIDTELKEAGELRWTGWLAWRQYRVEREYYVHKKEFYLYVEEKFMYDGSVIWTRETGWELSTDPWRLRCDDKDRTVFDFVEDDHLTNIESHIQEAMRWEMLPRSDWESDNE